MVYYHAKSGIREGDLGVFCFIDRVAEVKKNESLTAYFTLKGNEEFLLDHFQDFPVMPGVLQLESVKQAAAKLLDESDEKPGRSYRLHRVDAVRYGQFVKPGTQLKIFVRLLKKESDVAFFDGRIDLVEEGLSKGRALIADFSLIPTNEDKRGF